MSLAIWVCESDYDFDRVAAEWVAAHLEGPDPVLGLPTGGTPEGLYRELVRMHREEGLSFRSARTFNLDEYVGLAADHAQSYAHYMRERLFRHVDIDPSRTHIPNGLCEDPDEEARRYDALLREHGPIRAQVLGIGSNGHIGFNEPGTAFKTRTHTVKLTEETREANARFFESIDEVPRLAVTMGIANILESEAILLMAKGSSKQEALKRAFTEPPSIDVPASALQTHADVTVLVDREAAVGLEALLSQGPERS